MYHIIALGNPGAQYINTRHNVGWEVARALITHASLDALRPSPRYRGDLTEGVWHGETVTVLLPTTYMNNSGAAVAALVPKDARQRMVVVHDEVALPLGVVRVSEGSGAGGHNGVQSIIDTCGTKDFLRVRVGVGGPAVGESLERFVLSRFSPEEAAAVEKAVEKALLALSVLVAEGSKAAMNKINGS